MIVILARVVACMHAYVTPGYCSRAGSDTPPSGPGRAGHGGVVAWWCGGVVVWRRGGVAAWRRGVAWRGVAWRAPSSPCRLDQATQRDSPPRLTDRAPDRAEARDAAAAAFLPHTYPACKPNENGVRRPFVRPPEQHVTTHATWKDARGATTRLHLLERDRSAPAGPVVPRPTCEPNPSRTHAPRPLAQGQCVEGNLASPFQTLVFVRRDGGYFLPQADMRRPNQSVELRIYAERSEDKWSPASTPNIKKSTPGTIQEHSHTLQGLAITAQ